MFNELDKLGVIFDRIDLLESNLKNISCGMETLDQSLERLKCLDIQPVSRVVYLKESAKSPDPVQHEWSRLKLLSKFANLSGRAEEIEKEWQKIQQDEHNAYFSFQVLRGQQDLDYTYRKGIREGIQWCIDRFC
jgi:hypothetical protein